MPTIKRAGTPLSKLALVFVLNSLLFFPVMYQSYKHFDTRLTPWDVGAYMSMVDHPGEFEPPFRYRIVAPVIVKAMRIFPSYDIDINFTEDAAIKKDFFHFTVLNAGITILVSALLFLHLCKRLSEPFAYLGSLLYLFSFYSIVTNIIPMGDTSCHLAIIAAILLFENGKPAAFALACMIGAFTKETFLIIMGLWVFLNAWEERRKLFYIAYMLPGIAAYIAATRIWPAKTEFDYYSAGFLLHRALSFFNPREYNPSFLFHVYLSQVPFLLAVGVWLWLWAKPKGERMQINREILISPFLIGLGMTMDIGNSTGRVAFMAFPAIIFFEAKVIQSLFSRYGEASNFAGGIQATGN